MRVEIPGASIQFGILAQPQLEIAGAPDADKTTKNIFLRRLRFMVGGTLFNTFEFFVQTDWPNLFKLDPSDTMVFDKNGPGLNIQDAYVTWKLLAPFGDGSRGGSTSRSTPASCCRRSRTTPRERGEALWPGLLRLQLPPQRHRHRRPVQEHGQSPGPGHGLAVAGARGERPHRLPPRRVPGTPGRRGSAVHHDAGRGRGTQRAPGRGAAAVQLLDPEPGFFYQGTYLGAKKVLSIGGFFDFQDKYKYFGGDVFVDLPLGPGVLTAQFDVAYWDGGTFLSVPKATAYMGEAGYLIGPIMLSPSRHRGLVPRWFPIPTRMHRCSSTAPTTTRGTTAAVSRGGPTDTTEPEGLLHPVHRKAEPTTAARSTSSGSSTFLGRC